VTVVKSAIRALTPIQVTEGEREVTPIDFQKALKDFSDYVYSEAQTLWNNNAQIITDGITAVGKRNIPFKQNFIRNLGIDTRQTPLPGVMTGNIRELVEFKVCSEAESWVKNLNPHKQMFNFNRNIDLSATGDQFSKRVYNPKQNTITIMLRCMDRTFYIIFLLPKYIQSRSIDKVSKPRLRLVAKARTWEFVWDFTTFENPTIRAGSLNAGVDIGKALPYVVAVTNVAGKPVARYAASIGLKRQWDKYYRLGDLIAAIRRKVEAYQTLGINTLQLNLELRRVRTKRARIHAELSKQQASEITKKIASHDIGLVRVEKLDWLAGSTGFPGRGGSWSYARQQDDLAHSLSRGGIASKKVSPKNSSQLCWKCHTVLVHNFKLRTVFCCDCKTTLDRDWNAALNIATLNHLKRRELLAKFYGFGESGCSTRAQAIAGVDKPKACSVANCATLVASLVT
jgi:hypothetical protein